MVPSQNALRLAACPEKRPGKRVCWCGVERWFFAFLMWFSAPPGPVYDVKLDAIPPSSPCGSLCVLFLARQDCMISRRLWGSGHWCPWGGMAARAMKGDCFKSILTRPLMSAKNLAQERDVMMPTSGHVQVTRRYWYPFQHVAVARQNQASGQQLLAVDRALWQSAPLVRLAGKMGWNHHDAVRLTKLNPSTIAISG